MGVIVDPASVSLVRLALSEDLAGYGDVTSMAVVPADQIAQAEIVAREDLVVSGLLLAGRVLREVDVEASFERLVSEGEPAAPEQPIARMSGKVRSILTSERTMLNLLSHLCGVATQARRFAQAVEGSRARVVDTRKTTPGMRAWEKRAVVHGGCGNHRFGLFDMVLIKNNHLAAVGGVAQAVSRAKKHKPYYMKIEVEVEDEAQLREALEAGADIIMLDNVPMEEVHRLVRVARQIRPDVLLEASGGIDLEGARAMAATGVDLISTSALTMGAPPADLGLTLL